MQVKLMDWAPSPFSLKLRALLEYKNISYSRVSVLQPRRWLDVRRRGRIGKVPALEVEGRLYVDSTDIAYELERRFPLPPIIPASPRDRALCHALEEWSDESLYFVGLYFQWHDPEGRKMVPQVFGSSLYGRAMYRFYLRRVLRQIEGQGTGWKPQDHVRSDLERHLSAVSTLTQENPFLLGAQPYLCDFALLGQLVYLGRTPFGAKRIAEHAGVLSYLDRMKSLRRETVDPHAGTIA